MPLLNGDIRFARSANMAATPEGVHTLTLADTRTFTVQFAPGECIAATPIARPELPASAHPYVATVRLIEV